MAVKIFWCKWDGKTGSHDLLLRAAEIYCGYDVTGLKLIQNENGKPEFEGKRDLRFSISHSENFWACAIGDCQMGLDLQKEYEKDGEKLARRFFHPREIAWMEMYGFSQFSRIWTYKESYVKYTGIGLKQGLDYFSVIADPEKKNIGGKGPDGVWQQEISFPGPYWMVLTSRNQQDVSLEFMGHEMPVHRKKI